MGALLRPTVSEMTYTMSSGTLNSSIPYHTSVFRDPDRSKIWTRTLLFCLTIRLDLTSVSRRLRFSSDAYIVRLTNARIIIIIIIIPTAIPRINFIKICPQLFEFTDKRNQTERPYDLVSWQLHVIAYRNGRFGRQSAGNFSRLYRWYNIMQRHCNGKKDHRALDSDVTEKDCNYFVITIKSDERRALMYTAEQQRTDENTAFNTARHSDGWPSHHSGAVETYRPPRPQLPTTFD